MDISQYDSIQTTTSDMQVEGPRGEPLWYETGELEEEHDSSTGLQVLDQEGKPALCSVRARVTISLVSRDSPEYVRCYRSQVTNRVEQTGKAGKVTVTGDSVAEDKLELLIACTKGWTGWEDKGKELKFTPRNVRMLYTRLGFVREQVDGFIHDRGNFSTGELLN